MAITFPLGPTRREASTLKYPSLAPKSMKTPPGERYLWSYGSRKVRTASDGGRKDDNKKSLPRQAQLQDRNFDEHDQASERQLLIS